MTPADLTPFQRCLCATLAPHEMTELAKRALGREAGWCIAHDATQAVTARDLERVLLASPRAKLPDFIRHWREMRPRLVDIIDEGMAALEAAASKPAPSSLFDRPETIARKNLIGKVKTYLADYPRGAITVPVADFSQEIRDEVERILLTDGWSVTEDTTLRYGDRYLGLHWHIKPSAQ